MKFALVKGNVLLCRFGPVRSKAFMQFILVLLIGIVIGCTVACIVLIGKDQSKSIKTLEQMMSSHTKDEEFHSMENSTVADALYKKVRVLCWILTNPYNHKTKARHVKATWGKRCNVLLFMSSAGDESLPAIALNGTVEGRDGLWGKTQAAFKYVYKNYLDKADWFLKADDDTYVIVENLRYLLMKHDASEPVYFGCRYQFYVKQGYMSGGAGYVLSRKAVELFVEISLNTSTACNTTSNDAEDVQMGTCLEAAQVTPGDSRDAMGRERFLPLFIEDIIPVFVYDWLPIYLFYKAEQGMNCCSDSAISIHYVQPHQMYDLEYLIYHVRPYGISLNFEMPLELMDKSAVVGGFKNVTNDGGATEKLNSNFSAVSFVTNTNMLT